MYKGIIFDLDGTVLDTIETIAYYSNKALEEFGFNKIETKKYNYMAGNGAKVLIERALKEAGADVPKVFDRVFEFYNREYNTDTLYKTKVYEGIRELICIAKEKGLKLAILSNKPHAATADVVGKFFDEGTFELCFGAREGVPLKPHPAAAIAVAEELSLSPEECIYVGDTDVDMKTGKGAGFYTVGVLWGFRQRDELEESGADLIVSHPQEIVDLFKYGE